jgi:outer membrane protein TolC
MLLLCTLFFASALNAQNGNSDKEFVSLSLEEVIELAKEQSSAIKYVQNQNVNYHWRWKNFRARFRPTLSVSGNLPNYQQVTTPVTQPDGSVEFRQIQQLQTSANLSLSQPIPQTGASIYAATSMFRIQDFKKETIEWSGSPYYIGFSQPLFAYNWMKWSRRTEPLIYEESQKRYVEDVEEVALAAASRFFRFLQIQTNYQLAKSNLANSKDNLRIARVKKELGQISENDFSRIELSVLNAQKALNSAQITLKNADFELKSYIGMQQNMEIDLEIPLNMVLFYVDPDKALTHAIANRKETPYYKRRLITADRELTQAKRTTGLSTTLSGSFGVNNSAMDVPGLYENPEKQRQIRLSMSIPILDWGRSSSQVKLAESERELVLFDVKQDQQDFERQVVVEVELFNLLEDQINTAKEADKVAENGYQIALKKFQNGEISITDLNISLAEREAAKRDYIASIETYWESYYLIRSLTLYDFIKDQKLQYSNPMLR